LNNFEYDNKTKIIFGKGTDQEVGKYTKLYGKKVLLHYGSGSIKKYGLYDKVVKSLQEEGVDFVELGGVVANPRLSKVYEGIELCRKEDVDFILAVGGGSVIDSAKAISLGVHYDGDVWDFFSKRTAVEKVLPIGVVLTIPAAGSESSTATVITNEDGMYKRGTGHLLLRPVFSILNPELTFTLPNYQTAAGAVDMIGHVIERYFTNTKNVELTDRLCESVIRTVVHNTPLAIQENEDYNARAEIMWSGALAHNGLIGTGREEDWASHGIEHELSAMYDIAHGAGLAIIYPAWMKYVYKHDLDRFALFANKVFDIEINQKNLEETALKGIKALEDFYRSIGMPVRMSEAKMKASDIEEMANKATNNGQRTLGSFVSLNKEDVINIYKLAF
jgi:alcohol dehydrogenase YqhD (iron-dependent ADH family)